MGQDTISIQQPSFWGLFCSDYFSFKSKTHNVFSSQSTHRDTPQAGPCHASLGGNTGKKKAKWKSSFPSSTLDGKGRQGLVIEPQHVPWGLQLATDFGAGSETGRTLGRRCKKDAHPGGHSQHQHLRFWRKNSEPVTAS